MDVTDNLKRLPAVDQVLETLDDTSGGSGAAHGVVVEAVRDAIEELRKRIHAGAGVDEADLSVNSVAAKAAVLVRERLEGSLRPVINLTGIIVHTNLGRATISKAVLADVEQSLASYTNLEYDLGERRRGSRYDHVSQMLLRLVPGEAALIVNNNAAAILLILTEFASGRECIVSRGELIEIGGGFRIPDVMAQSGACLVEVGTTNRTRVDDYERALGPDTAMIFKAHHSNFRMIGFTQEASWAELSGLARRSDVMFVADLGSGLLAENMTGVTADEPGPGDVVSAGADLVCFSGDKLLGGPQAGVIVGKADLIERLRKNPLLRALRVDKFTIGCMEATLKRYLTGDVDEIPVVAALTAAPDEVRKRCRRVVSRVNRLGAPDGLVLKVAATDSEVGGGTLPGKTLPSYGIEVTHEGMSLTSIEEALRGGEPPVLGRLTGGRLVLDLRTMLEGQEEAVAGALARLEPREVRRG